MTRIVLLLLLLAATAPGSRVAAQGAGPGAGQGAAQGATGAAQSPPQSPPQPPHAWLFGTWTGGLFPVSSRISAEACLGQPVVIFTRDLVMRATLFQQVLTQREVETVRTTPEGAAFRFVPGQQAVSSLFGVTGAPLAGFGCGSPDVLPIQRRGENEIAFPGCADFPNPLVRCPGR